ncbi:MAG: SCO family protein [Hyphomonadaceae bacterium JAD_PAG50586_4]|nr:MAG: SCO family protein [Hyphomonadaceae bacterium JAD_PAG50586_4]
MAEPVETPRRNLTGAVVPAVAAAALAAVGTMLLVGRNGGEKTAELPVIENCILEGADAVNGPIELVDSNGTTVTQADFAGDPAILYFGFTHCPDICPTSMYTLAAALAEPNGYDVQPVLISLDPERDTPEVMGAYVQTDGFPQGLTGLTGTRAQVDAAKRSFHVYSARAPIEGRRTTSITSTIPRSCTCWMANGALAPWSTPSGRRPSRWLSVSRPGWTGR